MIPSHEALERALIEASRTWLQHRSRCRQCSDALEQYGLQLGELPGLSGEREQCLQTGLCVIGKRLRERVKAVARSVEHHLVGTRERRVH